MEEKLEDKLRNIKAKIVNDLKENYLEESKYNEIITKYLKEEEIITNNMSEMNKGLIRTQIATSKPIINPYGLKKDYVALENKELPNEIKKDIKKYNELEKQTINYLNETIKPNEKTVSEFIDIASSYINKSANLEDKFRKTIISGRIPFNLVGKIKYQFREEKKFQKEEYNPIEICRIINKI